MEHAVFNQDNFYGKFEPDLESARALVLLQSPFLAVRRIERLWRPLETCIKRGVRLCVFVQEPLQLDQEDPRLQAFEAARQLLLSLGLHVNVRPRIHEKVAVIDESILWEGSLNILSHNHSSERMTRWVSRSKVYEAIAAHRLASCQDCNAAEAATDPQLIGTFLAKRRKSLGMTQAELAEKAGLAQYTISEIETGKRDVRLSTLLRLCLELRLKCRCLPEFMVRALDTHINALP